MLLIIFLLWGVFAILKKLSLEKIGEMDEPVTVNVRNYILNFGFYAVFGL